MTVPLSSLKARALRLLAQREQSGVELRRKLTRHAAAAAKTGREARRDATPGTARPAAAGTVRADEGDDSEECNESNDGDATITGRVEEVLDWLRSNRYSSNERFVESRVNARWSRFGNLRIRDELSRHGVAPDAELSQRLNDSEMQRARHVWSLKFGAAPEDAAARARQYRFLTGRGFSPDVIRQTLRKAMSNGTAAEAEPAEASDPG